MASKAMAHLDLALRMSPHDPQNVRIYMALAAAHYAAGRFTEAVGYGRQAVPAASWFFRRSPNLRGQPDEGPR
jgi:Flp pilus assembly protein TadD